MGKPLIGITGRRWPATALGHHVPFAMHELHFDLHFTDYPRSVALAGGLPVELARDADVEELVQRLDGLVLSGGADVDPDLYGAEPDVNLGVVERERDEWELALFDAARRVDLPIWRSVADSNSSTWPSAALSISTSNSTKGRDIPSGTLMAALRRTR